MSEGALLKEYIRVKFDNPKQLVRELSSGNDEALYSYINRAIKKDHLTKRDRKKLKEEFGIDINQVLSNNNIVGNNIADNNSSISIGNDPSLDALKIENKYLKEKVSFLEGEIEKKDSIIKALLSKP